MNRFLGALRAPSAVIWITLLAALVRIVLVLARHDWSNPEAWEYGIIADNLLAGKGYSGSAWFVPEGPTAFMAPGYVFLLYGAQSLFGGAGFAGLQFVQAIVGAACVWLLYGIVARFFDSLTAAVAAIILALHPAHAYLTTYMHPIVLSTCLLLASIFFLIRLRDSPNARNALLLGVTFGIALLTEPAILCIAPAIALAMITTTELPVARRFMWIGIAIGIAVIVVSPWTIRNYIVFERFVPVKSPLGYLVWAGNHEGASGVLPYVRDDGTVGHVNERVPEEVREKIYRMSEPDAYAALGRVALVHMLNYPGETAVRMMKKASYYWVFPYWIIDPADKDRPYLAHIRRPEEVFWFLLLIPAIAGVAIRRDRVMAMLYTLLPCACFTALYAITNVGSNARYRLPIEPLIIVWTAVAIVWILTRTRDTTGEEV